MNNSLYPRDLHGYGQYPPQANWPGRARIAVQFVLNYEEGGENCVPAAGQPLAPNASGSIRRAPDEPHRSAWISNRSHNRRFTGFYSPNTGVNTKRHCSHGVLISHSSSVTTSCRRFMNLKMLIIRITSFSMLRPVWGSTRAVCAQGFRFRVPTFLRPVLLGFFRITSAGPSSSNEATMKAIDLFAGAGGFSTGATLAGCEVVWAANHWPEAVEWHAANHPVPSTSARTYIRSGGSMYQRMT